MLRCASSLVITSYEKVRLAPQDSRALPAELFTEPSNLACFSTFYEFTNIGALDFSEDGRGRHVGLEPENAVYQ